MIKSSPIKKKYFEKNDKLKYRYDSFSSIVKRIEPIQLTEDLSLNFLKFIKKFLKIKPYKRIKVEEILND